MAKSQHIKEWIFGLHAVEAVLQQRPEAVLTLWVQTDRDDGRLGKLIKLASTFGVSIEKVHRSQLEKVLPLDARHQGVAAQTKGLETSSEQDLDVIVEKAGDSLLLLVLDGVQDPHNLGACIRTANASGAHAVIVPKDNATGLTPVARKVASGAAERTPFIQVTNLSRTLKSLQTLGVWIYGADGDAEQNIYVMDFKRPVALVLGAEGTGMRRLTRESCDELVAIPMYGSVESLNVSVAAGVCLYAVVQARINKS